MRLGSYVELRHACCRLLGNDTCCRDSATLRPQRRECPGTPPQVSTKASLRLDVSERSAWWLPPAVRERLLERQRGCCHHARWLLRQTPRAGLTRPRDSFLQAPSPRAANCCSRATRRDRRRGACCTRSIVPAATCCSSPAATAGAQPGARPRAAAGGGGRGGRRTRRKSTISPRPFTTHPRADSPRRHGRQASVEPREYVDRRSLPETEGKRHERVREKRQHGRKKESRASRRVAFE